MPADRRPFYEAYVLTEIAFNRDGNRMLGAVADALGAVKAGDKARAHQDIKSGAGANRRHEKP